MTTEREDGGLSVSEEPGIRVFEPHQVPGRESFVWAIDDEHLRNYLVPRECPRVNSNGGDAPLKLHGARLIRNVRPTPRSE